jgi:Sigma-70 region 2
LNETPLSLLDRLRRQPRDQPSWRRLTMLYAPLIHRWLQQHDTPEADADDLAQEVLLVLARDLGDFDHNGGMKKVVSVRPTCAIAYTQPMPAVRIQSR